jgi:hypothetical protein
MTSHPVIAGTTRTWRAWLALGAVACHSGPVLVTSVPATSAPTTTVPAVEREGRLVSGWRIATREHVDLWLHGFAMLQADSSLVPYFRLDYRDAVSVARRQSGATSLFDANRERLRQRTTDNPALTSAQFVGLYFASWEDLQQGVERFLRDNGNVDAARTTEMRRMYATLATYFPSSADRDWLRIFVQSLEDERTRFFTTYWRQQQQARAPVQATIESQWNGGTGMAIGRFLTASNQRRGTIVLSTALGGEGRTLNVGRGDNIMAVTFPLSGEDAREAFFVAAHEAVGTVSNQVVRDNSSAADERSGESARWSSLAAVRGGALMLERVAPELADGYRRYYLRLARQPVNGDIVQRFASTFAIPDPIRVALERQIALILGGI